MPDIPIGRDETRAERQRGNMSLADRTQAENETSAARRYSRLIRMGHDTRIEQSSCFERIFVQKVRADEPALVLGERRVFGEGVFHLSRASLERLEQIAVASQKILQHLR